MPEARDRLSRQEDVFATYSNRRPIFSSGNRNLGRGNNSVTFILEDATDEGQATGTPFRWRGIPMGGTPGQMGAASGRGSIGISRIGRGANFHRSPRSIIGRENLSPVFGSRRGRGRGSNVLPHWYPRKPLRDITAIVRAIERTRRRLEDSEVSQNESPVLQDQTVRDPSVSTSSAQPEHDFSFFPPNPTFGAINRPHSLSIGKVPKILLDITNQNKDGDSCLTPQKKLLNNIDTVEKVVMEELRKLKRTPAAKKAEREKRVKTLMSMR